MQEKKMITQKITPPATMSLGEKRAFRRLVSSLIAVEIDPTSRADLVDDFVRLDARIQNLRVEEAAAEGKARAAATRSLTTATSERRRLHAALFVGARRKPKDPAQAPMSPEKQRHYDAWMNFLRWRDTAGKSQERSAAFWAEADSKENALKAEFGMPGMRVLMDARAEMVKSEPPLPPLSDADDE
jgi:hypothetical protein